MTCYIRPHHSGRGEWDVRPPLKKSLFPVQRVAVIVASRAAAKKKDSIFVGG